MSDQNDDVFGEDEDEAARDFDRLGDVLYQRIAAFAEEEDVDDEILPPLLLRLSLSFSRRVEARPLLSGRG
jgi:hypothetical protein